MTNSETQQDEREWEIINKSREERPLLQEYDGIDSLPPIPVSIPQKGALGNTGEWRTYRPVIDHENCIQCAQCYMFCPEGTISHNKVEDKFEIDYIYCKGCGICANQCPKKCIAMERENK